MGALEPDEESEEYEDEDEPEEEEAKGFQKIEGPLLSITNTQKMEVFAILTEYINNYSDKIPTGTLLEKVRNSTAD